MYCFILGWQAFWKPLWFAIEKSLLPLSVDITVDRALKENSNPHSQQVLKKHGLGKKMLCCEVSRDL